MLICWCDKKQNDCKAGKEVKILDMTEFCTMQKLMIRLQAEGKHKPRHRFHDKER